MRFLRNLSLSFFISLVCTANAYAKLNIGATTEDVAAIVKAVVGEDADVFSIAKGTQDPHQIEAKPSFMVKFRHADLIVSQGLELESAWVVPLIRGARNPKIAIGSSGFLELGPSLDPIEVARGSVSRADGDVHPEGNPHFQLDPIRVGKAAVVLADRLGELDSERREQFKANAGRFQRRMEEGFRKWKARIEKTDVKEFVSYHKTLSYFADRFGLKNTLHLEPKPGIPPTAGHIVEVIGEMKKRGLRLVMIENYFDDSVKGKILSEVGGAKVVKVPVSIGGDPSVRTFEDLFETLVKAVELSQ